MTKIICLLTCVFLLNMAGVCFSQQGSPERLDLETFVPNPPSYPIAAYGIIVTKRIVAFDNAARIIDPNGLSTVNSITMIGAGALSGITTDVMYGSGVYSVNFSNGEAQFSLLFANKIYWAPGSYPGTWDLDPFDERARGKFVYDIAEAVFVPDGDIGDVVVISQDKDLTVVRSKCKFDTRVAGVVSENPKLCLGSKEEPNFKFLALAGVVRCNANTEHGPIKKGDLLVSSSEPGFAMRADSNELIPGMIVGSALEPLPQGKGKIYILVNQ